ncbi:MAG TPA: hypothetical protein VFM93_00545 [Candidatus Limnocylindria bacterium]|nr:hypothetical protein [Candidatus Limnocylindria bacterium]
MSGLHATLANTLVLYLTLLGLWGLFLGIRASGPTPSYRGALVIAEVAAIAQGLIGLFLALQRPLDPIHALYGVALVAALPLAATLVRDREARGQSVALGIAALFAAGLAIRGIATAT